jgi:hypothetical protein
VYVSVLVATRLDFPNCTHKTNDSFFVWKNAPFSMPSRNLQTVRKIGRISASSPSQEGISVRQVRFIGRLFLFPEEKENCLAVKKELWEKADQRQDLTSPDEILHI